MLFRQLFDQNTWTYTYLLADPDSRQAVIIDPVHEQVDRDLQLVAELGLELVYTLDTHVHADHVTGSGELRKRAGAKSGVAAVAQVACVDCPLSHGDTLQFGRYTVQARRTPGHTNGCLTFVVEADGQTMAFTGDALFVRGCGRTDFQQGDAATLYQSIHEQIFSLPDNTLVYPGHDYKGHTMSTVSEEKTHNPRLNTTISKEQFIQIMSELDLAYPKRIHEALPANLACGLVPQDQDHPSAKGPIKQLSAEQLTDPPAGLIVDVRSREEFEGELGHLRNAILAPLPELKQLAANWNPNLPMLVVCRSGGRSTQACEILTDMGFTDITNLTGGMLAVRQQQGLSQ